MAQEDQLPIQNRIREHRMSLRFSVPRTFVAALLLTSIQMGCSVEQAESTGTAGGGGEAAESKRIDTNGSSTVGPITNLVGEEFEALNADTEVLVTITGTGTGFGKFAAGETDISNASRAIKDSEKEECEKNGVEYVELTVAMDGISVVVNNENDFIETITTAQLKKIWAPDSTVKTWKDVNPEWPDEEIDLFGPGRESGTFDYFTKKINGEEGASRTEYQPSSDDNQLVTGVSGSKFALGYFGYGYYEQNKDKLKLLKVSATDDVADGVLPSPEAIQSGTYKPLARPVFIYISKEALKRKAVQDFATFYLNDGQALIPKVGCVNVSDSDLEASRKALADALL